MIGIRREDKHEWEARVPLTPEGVRELVEAGIDVVVQPSTIRAYDDDAYRAAGARIDEDVSACNAVFAVKEIPASLMRNGGVYVFFSHTIKGQKQNMPMLKRMMDLGCTLIDYEKITDDDGRRLVFFGHHAGLAGMIDTLHVLGRRLEALGTPTVLSEVKLAHEYRDLDHAKSAISAIGDKLRDEPLPDTLTPFVCGFAGYGNVSRGAQAIYDLLPTETVEPQWLPGVSGNKLYKVVFKEEHLVEPLDGTFELQEYYDHPERYRSVFDKHVRHLTVLVNAIYWTEKYPRLITNQLLNDPGAPKLLVVGDISCDIGGAVECTVKATTPGAPSYIYQPDTGAIVDGISGPGLAMMTTDCLPCELPKESSASFTEALAPFVPPIAKLDNNGAFDDAEIPGPIARATILWRGELTPPFAYLRELL